MCHFTFYNIHTHNVLLVLELFCKLWLQAERSGCGSGSCGFLALLYHKELIRVDELKTFINGKTQSQLTGRIVKVVTVKELAAVITEVSGRSFYTGECTYYCEDDDTLPFLQLK